MRSIRVVLLGTVLAGALLVAVVGPSQSSPGSICGSVNGGAGARLAARVAGTKVSSTIGGRLRGQPCSLSVTVGGPARGYSAAFALTRGRLVLARKTIRLRGGTTRFVLALSGAWHGIATLRMMVSSPRGAASVTRRLTLGPARVTVTFYETDSEQRFVVPAGVTAVQVRAVGAAGAGGGGGAIVSGSLPVHAGEVLYVEVGGSPKYPRGAFGGYNGGGNGSAYVCEAARCPPAAGGGGGASDIRTTRIGAPGSLGSRLLVAAGGGGVGADYGGAGTERHPAGGSAGAGGQALMGGGGGGQPGTQTDGGAGGAGSGNGSPGSTGALGVGGNGGKGGAPRVSGFFGGDGGGGGGGLLGGGGGGGGDAAEVPNQSPEPGGGGGGGSSLIPANGTFVLAPTTEYPSVTITFPSRA